MDLLNIIFPKYCVNCKKIGDYVCSSCFSRISFDTKNICLVCLKSTFDGMTHPKCVSKSFIEGTFTGVVYSGVVKKILYSFKYKPYVVKLSELIGNLLFESLIQNENFLRALKEKPVFVPIPLSSNKLRKRGYNQAEIISKILSNKFNFKSENYLIRIKDTKPQFGLDRKDRRENIEGVFEFSDKSKNIKNKNIILVDDVLTTGATFSEACKVLKKAGAGKVWAVAFAKED